jgi:protein-disulfide isomerase
MMRLIKILSGVVICGMGLAACQQDTRGLESKIAELQKGQEEIKAMLKSGARGAAAPSRPARPAPDPSKAYSVPVDGDAVEGPADAKVTVVKAFDYACPFCDRARSTMDDLKKKYGKDVRIVYKHYVVHPQMATSMALAACAGQQQGKYRPMSDLLWDEIFKTRKFDADKCWTTDQGCPNIEGLAKKLQLNVAKLREDMKGTCNALIQKDQQDLATFGVSATPAFFINGRFLSGAQPIESFSVIVDEELKKANERIAQGTPAADYYKVWVMEKGEKKLPPVAQQ